MLTWKGLGRLYTEQGRPRKALQYLRKADAYYASHAKEEAGFRAENLENIKRMLSLRQKRMGRLAGILTGLVLVAAAFLLRRRKVHKSAAPAAPEAMEVLSKDAPALSKREKEILDLLSKGYTTPQIAEGLGLSPETVKWYRKKLLVKFDVSNTAELVTMAKESGII